MEGDDSLRGFWFVLASAFLGCWWLDPGGGPRKSGTFKLIDGGRGDCVGARDMFF